MGLSAMQATVRVSPLTVLVRGAIERWLAPEILEKLAEQSQSNNYERKITLQALTAVMLDAVVGMQPTVHAAALARREQWQGSVQALYTKFARVDPQFAMALVRHTAAGIAPLLEPTSRAKQLPLARRVKILDGTMPDGSEHRLGVLRRLRAAGLPAQAVIVYDLATGLCERVAVSEDAYTNERPLAEILLQAAQAEEIYVGDRGLCTRRLIHCVLERQAFFIFREYPPNLVYRQQLPEKPRGRCATGRVCEGSVSLVGLAPESTWELRRNCVQLDVPTQEGETQIQLLTNLPASYRARTIAELYRKRWQMERHFHTIKRELHGQMPSLGEPRAAIFALCVSLAAGNVLALVKHLQPKARASTKPASRPLSAYYLALEISRSYAAIEAITSVRLWKHVAELSPISFLRWAKQLARCIVWSHYLAHPRGPKKHPPPRLSGKHRHHYSTYRLLNANQKGSTAC
jgi:Transposase DDE domain